MSANLFPQPITNQNRGAPVAIWVLILLMVMTIGRSLVVIVISLAGRYLLHARRNIPAPV